MEPLNGICDILTDIPINLSDWERERYCFNLAIIATYCILLTVWKDLKSAEVYIKKKTVKFGKMKIKLFESPESLTMQVDFGRYKKGRKIETRTIYDAISEKHKMLHDEIWLDVQDKKAIGMNINLDKK